MLLMEEAERIAREEHGSSKMAVISGLYSVSVAAHYGFAISAMQSYTVEINCES